MEITKKNGMNNHVQYAEKLRHSTAHLLAQAVLELYPDTLLTIGPSTEDGFFYDLLPVRNFKEEDLSGIELRMYELSKKNLPILHSEILKTHACEIFKNNKFKMELIDGIPGDTVGLAQQGDFYDLCKGGHVATTGEIKHFKLTGISGSYWRANRDGIVLQRISGISFLTADELNEYQKLKEDAQKYDHRKLGKQLDLFSFHDEGVGFPFFHAKGKVIINGLVSYMRTMLSRAGYLEIETPFMLSDELWRRSGHYEFYKNNMYFSDVENKNYAIKPMNCPGSILIYKERPRSYRELPLRLNEFGKVHRHELSGVLHGLFRVRAFTIDDTHIYCTIDQIEQEILQSIMMYNEMIKRFGFDSIKIGLSTRPANAMGDIATWEVAIAALKNALNSAGLSYVIQEGEGAFYGPKIEFKIQDSMNREWQCGTIQLDFFQPENFDLHYVASGGVLVRPVIIHQALYGSLERFLGILLEHHKGLLPLWISPIQIAVLPIADAQRIYAQEIAKDLQKNGLRVVVDSSGDMLASQVKNAQLDKIPLMLIIGKRELEQKLVTLRYFNGDQEHGLTIERIIEIAQSF